VASKRVLSLGGMDADAVTMRHKVEGETVVKRGEGEVVRRRQVELVKRRGANPDSCLHCCHCCRRRGRRLSYQELGGQGEPLIPRPRSLFVTPEPVYEELGPPSPPNLTSMQTLDVRLRESRGELVERGVRDFQDYPDSGLGSEQGSLGRLSTDSHVIMGDEVLLAPVASKQGRPGSWLEAARSYLRRLAKRPQTRRSQKVGTSVLEREPGTSSVV